MHLIVPGLFSETYFIDSDKLDRGLRIASVVAIWYHMPENHQKHMMGRIEGVFFTPSKAGN
jgi:hypothetical protein